jgi:hypothetical protein
VITPHGYAPWALAFALKHCEKYPMHVYEIRPRKDKRGFDLISDALPFGRLWYAEPNAVSDAIGYASFSLPNVRGAATPEK